MSKIYVLLFFTIVSSFCVKQDVTKVDALNSPTPPPVEETNKQVQNSSNTLIDYENADRFECFSSPAKEKMWVLLTQTRKVIFTTDGGETWENVEAEHAMCVDFADENHGWIISTGEREKTIWITTDGGTNWTSKPLKSSFSYANEMRLTDSSTGWVRDSHSLSKTTDKGETWTQVMSYVPGDSKETQYLRGQPEDMFFLDSQTGWVCDAGNTKERIYSTTDAGKTWNAKKIDNNNSQLCNLFFINPDEGWYNLGFNRIFHTKDSGKTWDKIPSIPAKFMVRSMFWFNSNEGWLVGYIENQPRTPKKGTGTVLKTNDGGKNWDTVEVDKDIPFFVKIHFTDSQNGWLLSRDSIYKTNDGGKNWNSVYKLPPVVNP